MPKPTPWSACTAQMTGGDFCDAPSLPDAPFPICLRHAAQMYAFLREHVAVAASDEELSMDIFCDLAARRQALPVYRTPEGPGVIYYVQVGELIKIGCTGQLSRRLAGYPPNRRLLATEPGLFREEAERLRQFAPYLSVGREWFTPGPELVRHINALRRKQRARPLRIA